MSLSLFYGQDPPPQLPIMASYRPSTSITFTLHLASYQTFLKRDLEPVSLRQGQKKDKHYYGNTVATTSFSGQLRLNHRGFHTSAVAMALFEQLYVGPVDSFGRPEDRALASAASMSVERKYACPRDNNSTTMIETIFHQQI